MLKILIERWDENKGKLKHELSTRQGLNDCDYKDLVKLTFETIFNSNEAFNIDKLDLDHITEVNDGDYQGTLIYLIPFDTYQPSEYEYLMTYVGYGSCSVCDTLQSIQEYGEGLLTEKQVNHFMNLCKDILSNTIKPYNYGWMRQEEFEHMEGE